MNRLPDWIDADRAREFGLTQRMQDILVGFARGWTNAEIGEYLHLGTNTIHVHAKALAKQLGSSNRAHAVAMSYDYGILRTRAVRLEMAHAAGLRVAS